MHLLGKRGLLLIALGLLAVPVTAAGVAYACTALATISTSSPSALAGSSVTVSGKYFAPHDPSDIRASPAVVHMDRVDGPALASVSPGPAADGGRFSVDITVPAVDPGEHVVIVTQSGIDGRPAYGTPARAVLMIDPTPPPVAAAPLPPPTTVPAPLAEVPNAAAVTPPAVAKVRTMAQRIAACKSRYRISAAKTKKGRKRLAARRAACIRALS